MKTLQQNILKQIVEGAAEPVIVARTGGADWPVAFCNPAFNAQAGKIQACGKPFADVLEELLGRNLALEISEAIRTRRESTIPVEINKRECFMVLKPLLANGEDEEFYVAYIRGAGANPVVSAEVQQALINAKHRIRDLSREDPVTGLLNARSFRDVLDHDWAVAKREKTQLALVAFTFDEFDKYLEVFGRHAADSCQRRVAGAIRRCLKRASDVAARIQTGNDEKLVVLSHSGDTALVQEFAARIAKSVRDLGLHHPRSKAVRFVTVSFKVVVSDVGNERQNAADFLDKALDYRC
jgi:diguanylate cyclase (GGDEF)-like protein